jgi:TRAP-type mannitol/chloroaromatic compound transport system permease small subunit
VIPLAAVLMLSQVIAQLLRRVYTVFTGQMLATAVAADKDIDAVAKEVAP